MRVILIILFCFALFDFQVWLGHGYIYAWSILLINHKEKLTKVPHLTSMQSKDLRSDNQSSFPLTGSSRQVCPAILWLPAAGLPGADGILA